MKIKRTTYDNSREIARFIVLAQDASDFEKFKRGQIEESDLLVFNDKAKRRSRTLYVSPCDNCKKSIEEPDSPYVRRNRSVCRECTHYYKYYLRDHYHDSYRDKSAWMEKALKMIISSRSGWDFYVESNKPDQNGYSSTIVYFQYTDVDKNRYEVSFHTPTSKNWVLRPYIGKGRKTHWNKKIGGSKADAQRLIDYFNL